MNIPEFLQTSPTHAPLFQSILSSVTSGVLASEGGDTTEQHIPVIWYDTYLDPRGNETTRPINALYRNPETGNTNSHRLSYADEDISTPNTLLRTAAQNRANHIITAAEAIFAAYINRYTNHHITLSPV